MSQVYTVSNSMRAKDRDGNPKVWNSQYGEFEVWNVYFQGDDNKYQVNKKPGFGGYTKGQQVYGTATLGQYGGQFKQEQAPDGVQLSSGGQPAASAPQQSAPQAGSSVEQKLDYIISLLENKAQFQGNDAKPAHTGDVSPTDIDDKPIDLSQIDY